MESHVSLKHGCQQQQQQQQSVTSFPLTESDVRSLVQANKEYFYRHLIQCNNMIAVKMVAVDYNWGPPISGRYDHDFLRCWVVTHSKFNSIDQEHQEERVFLHFRGVGSVQNVDAWLNRDFQSVGSPLQLEGMGVLKLWCFEPQSPLEYPIEFVFKMTVLFRRRMQQEQQQREQQEQQQQEQQEQQQREQQEQQEQQQEAWDNNEGRNFHIAPYQGKGSIRFSVVQ